MERWSKVIVWTENIIYPAENFYYGEIAMSKARKLSENFGITHGASPTMYGLGGANRRLQQRS